MTFHVILFSFSSVIFLITRICPVRGSYTWTALAGYPRQMWDSAVPLCTPEVRVWLSASVLAHRKSYKYIAFGIPVKAQGTSNPEN